MGREWLVIDHENVVMFYKECCMYAKEKNKTSWSEIIILTSKVEAVKDHEKKNWLVEILTLESYQPNWLVIKKVNSEPWLR